MQNITWKNRNVQIVIVCIAIIIIGFCIKWLANPKSNATIDDKQQAAVMPNSVAVSNQPAGAMVKLDKVVLVQPGWVAIHDNNNGTPGKILGAALFDKGTHTGSVELLRATAPGKSYFAVIHSDDGDYKDFNFMTDTPLKDQSGKTIMIEFKTTK
jgi:hypothetical protein